jgi:hypothetical protein
MYKLFKHIRAFKTYEFWLKNQSSLFLYFELIEIAYFLRHIKINLELLDNPDEVLQIKKIIKEIEAEFEYIFIYKTRRFTKRNIKVEFIFDNDLTILYNIFKKFDSLEGIEFQKELESRNNFYKKLLELKKILYKNYFDSLPSVSKKDINRLQKIIKELKNAK